MAHPTLTKWVQQHHDACSTLDMDYERRKASDHRRCMKELNVVTAVFWACCVLGTVVAFFSYMT